MKPTNFVSRTSLGICIAFVQLWVALFSSKNYSWVFQCTQTHLQRGLSLFLADFWWKLSRDLTFKIQICKILKNCTGDKIFHTSCDHFFRSKSTRKVYSPAKSSKMTLFLSLVSNFFTVKIILQILVFYLSSISADFENFL